MSPQEVLRITADEVARATDSLWARRVPRTPSLLVMQNVVIRLLLREGVAPELIVRLVSDSLDTIARQGY